MRGGRRVAPLPSPRRGRRWIRAFRERPETDEGAPGLRMSDLATCADAWAGFSLDPVDKIRPVARHLHRPMPSTH